jgi:DNA-binding NtrC family response regulator
MATGQTRILIADDQPEILSALSFLCAGEDYATVTVDNPAEVIAKISSEEFDLALIDLNYNPDRQTGAQGLDLLKQIRQIDPHLPVVVMTAWGSIPLAVEAIQLGAKDFVQKPWENERLLSILRNQVALREAVRGRERLEAENQILRRSQVGSEGFVALSSPMKQVEHLIRQVAPTDANVLITGENGTGKSLIARLIHQASGRAGQPLVTVNMGGLPEGTFESEMFGHVRGAFTDARTDRVGRFELADRGTLFLDEIANLTASQQAKILRILETGEFERVGSSKTKQVDVRILSATNAELQRDIQVGKFREDLFFRLNTIEIHVPPLRERRDDIPVLSERFLEELKARYRKPATWITGAAVTALQSYAWPGNVRELRHVIERAVLLTTGDEIRAEDLHLGPTAGQTAQLDEMDLDGAEALLIKRALDRHGGNAILAAKSLGLSRSAFYRRLQKHKM